jgi:hypothetical protein
MSWCRAISVPFEISLSVLMSNLLMSGTLTIRPSVAPENSSAARVVKESDTL